MQIVLLALLNDGAILSIAYDNVRYRINRSLEHARGARDGTILGSLAPWRPSHVLPRRPRLSPRSPELRTMMYLTLSVAGHLTIFQARTRGPSGPSDRPCPPTGGVGTQVVATLIAGSASS